MKKYLFGMLAIALAVGFSAFTKPAKENSKFATYYFEFIGTPSVASDLETETSTYWRYLGTSNSVSCPTPDQDKVCVIRVDEDHIDGTNLQNVTIIAANGASGNKIVDASSTGILQILNADLNP
jgi:hypothetical protein